MDWNSTEPRPGTSKEDSHSISSKQYPVQSEDETPNKKSILGFALTSTYGSQVDDIEENVPSYYSYMADVTKLTAFLEKLPCKHCPETKSEIFLTKKNGFAQELTIHCKSMIE